MTWNPLSPLEAAQEYLRHGWRSIPVPRGRKGPIIERWGELRLAEADLEEHFGNGPVNIGLLLGSASAGLLDVDLDSPEALALAPAFLPETAMLSGRDLRPRSHFWYSVVGAPPDTRQFHDPLNEGESGMLLELRSSRAQTIVPPSQHPKGGTYSWEGPLEPANVAASHLETAVSRLAAASLVLRYWPRRNGTRHLISRALAGALLRHGWEPSAAEHFIGTIARAAEDEEAEARARDVRSTLDTIREGKKTTGLPALRDLLGAPVVSKIAQWLSLGRAEQPEVILVRAKLAAVADEAEHALASDPGLFVRAGRLVHVVRGGGRKIPGLVRPAGTPAIVPVSLAHLRERLDRVVRFERPAVKDDKEPAQVLPPRWVAEVLLDRGQWALRHLETVTETPCLLPDGSVLDVPGYHEATGTLYDPVGVSFPPIPARPGTGEAWEAIGALLEPFEQFPFVADADRSALLAAILTLLARPAIAGPCPMFAMRAPTPGSGKSLLAEAVAIIGTGRAASRMTAAKTDEENRKRILSIALEGSRAVLLDNLESPFGSACMAVALTATEWSDRGLAQNKILTASLRAVWLATGNNLTFRGDLPRRVVPIDLDPGLEHPEDRTGFKHPELLEYVRAERGRLVASGLTILRAFYVAGAPRHAQPAKGSFESWDRVVRSALVWTGLEDPLETAERIRNDSDSDLDNLRLALAAWETAFHDRPTTAAHAVRSADDDSDLKAALAAFANCADKDLTARKLGYALRKHRGRIAGGRRFEQAGIDTKGIIQWHITR